MKYIEEIFAELGFPNETPPTGGKEYKEYKKRRFLNRLKVCMNLHCKDSNHNDEELMQRIDELHKEEQEQLQQAVNPRSILQLFLEWRGGNMSFLIEGESIQLLATYEKTEYDLRTTLTSHRQKKKKREEILKKKDSLCLEVLTNLIERGIICL